MTEAPDQAATGAAAGRFRARAVPLIVATALLMENIDGTVIATSLPQIAADLGADPIHLKLALTSYLLALAVFIPASGWAADRYGARPVFRLAIVVFAAGSVACAQADSLLGLILARVLQGLGGSMMVPVGRLIVLRASARTDLVSALAWLTIPALIGPVLGPPLGGFITTFFDWRWIFWINVPIAVLGFALVTLLIPDVRIEAVRDFDIRGFLLLGPGLGAFLTGVTLSGLGLVPDLAAGGLAAAGLGLLCAYVPHALGRRDPIVDLRLLRLPTFRAAATGGTLFRIGVGALPFLLPLLLQIGFGLTAFQTGLLTFSAGLGALGMKFLAQPILRRFGFRRVLVANAVISALFILAPASFTPQTPWPWIMAVLFLGGLSRSLQFTSINAVGYSDVPSDQLSSATSFSSVLQQLSGSVGITVAAFGLEAMQRWYGLGPVAQAYFPAVFAGIAAVSLSSALFFARLPPTAGAALLGRVGAALPPDENTTGPSG